MELNGASVTVLGGSGFLGRYVVSTLAKAGARVRVGSRFPDRAKPLKTAGQVGQILLDHVNIADAQSVARAVAGADAVVNLVGILAQHGRQRFTTLHAQGAEQVARAATEAGAKRLVHISALGVDSAKKSVYARTKLAGEQAVRAAFPGATILRPGLLFGAEDQSLNRFAQMASLSPLLPLVGGGKTRFQPVYVGDVAAAVRAVLEQDNMQNALLPLVGPATYSLRDLMLYAATEAGFHPHLVSLPFPIAHLVGALCEWLPAPLLTRDQVTLLRSDNILPAGLENGLEWLGITPTAMESVAPHYLARYRPGGAFAAFTQAEA
jgi:uncharacterized protein YbjT (DUF2867 family)